MTFIDNSARTNWKFIGIVAILAVLVGGGVFAWQYFGLPEEIEDETAFGKSYGIVADDSGRIIVAEINDPTEYKGVSIELHIADDQISLLSEPEIVNGYPNYLLGSYDFMARAISFNGDALGEYGFGDPRIILGEQGYQGPSWLDSVDFSLIIPYFKDTKTINIFSSTKLMLSIDISYLTSE